MYLAPAERHRIRQSLHRKPHHSYYRANFDSPEGILVELVAVPRPATPHVHIKSGADWLRDCRLSAAEDLATWRSRGVTTASGECFRRAVRERPDAPAVFNCTFP